MWICAQRHLKSLPNCAAIQYVIVRTIENGTSYSFVFQVVQCCMYIEAAVLSFASVISRSGRRLRLPGRRDGLGSLRIGSAAGLRVPSHLLLLSLDLGHIPHGAPLQYSRATPGEGPICPWPLDLQRPAPTRRPRQRLRSAGQRGRLCCGRYRPPRTPAQVVLRAGRGQLGDLQCQAAQQGGSWRAVCKGCKKGNVIPPCSWPRRYINVVVCSLNATRIWK